MFITKIYTSNKEAGGEREGGREGVTNMRHQAKKTSLVCPIPAPSGKVSVIVCSIRKNFEDDGLLLGFDSLNCFISKGMG